MIERLMNNVKMQLEVVAIWIGPEIIVTQRWDHPQHMIESQIIELSVSDALQLIEELLHAIKTCREMNDEYMDGGAE